MQGRESRRERECRASNPDLSSLLLDEESASAVTGIGDGDRVGQAGGDLLQFDGSEVTPPEDSAVEPRA